MNLSIFFLNGNIPNKVTNSRIFTSNTGNNCVNNANDILLEYGYNSILNSFLTTLYKSSLYNINSNIATCVLILQLSWILATYSSESN